MTELARILERLVRICERGVGMPTNHKAEDRMYNVVTQGVLANRVSQRTMLRRIVKRDRAIKVRSRFHERLRYTSKNAHEPMPDHERDRRLLLLSERQELRRKLAHHVAVERYKVRDPEAVEDREQQQRIFGRLSERFGLFDQQTCPLRSRLGFRRSISFDMQSGVISAT